MCKNNHYVGEVRLNPVERTIKASLTVTKKTEGHNNFKFYLPTGTLGLTVTSEDLETYEVSHKPEWCPFIYGDTEVSVQLKSSVAEQKAVKLDFNYEAELWDLPEEGMNIYNEQLTEIGVYVPWFPLTERMEEATFDIRVSGCQDEVFIGADREMLKDCWRIRQKQSSVGCVLLGSKAFSENKMDIIVGELTVGMYWADKAYKDMAGRLSNEVAGILKLYTDSYGDAGISKLNIVITARSNSDGSGGYCRPGLIVLPGIQKDEGHWKYRPEDENYMFKYLAHELAHLWWCKADYQTWDNWLNESFAEYSCLRALRHLKGQEAYDQLIQTYEEKSRGLRAIEGCGADDENHFDVWYVKGAYILSKLEAQLGYEGFDAAAARIHKRPLITTEAVLNEAFVREVDAVFLRDMLKK